MVLTFENDKAGIKFIPEDEVDAKTFIVKVFAANKSDGGNKHHVYTSKEYSLNKGENNWYIIIDYIYYNTVAKRVAIPGKPLPNIIEFSFSVVFDEIEEKITDTFVVHFVRYIPKLLNILGWFNGEKLQRIWFTNKSNIDKEKVDPQIDIISWDWIMIKSKEANEEYQEFYNYINSNIKAYFNNNTKSSLRNEIQKMIKNGITTLPSVNNKETDFGTFSKRIITYSNNKYPSGEKAPIYEKYYFDHKPFSGFWDLGKHFLRDGFNDFVASLANFNFHVVAKGKLIYETGGYFSKPYIKVKVTRLAFYIKDNWDFIDSDNEEQSLGFWKILTSKNKVKVERSPSNKEEYFEVTNKSYRDYRDDHGMGYNYHVYSTLNIQPVNIELSL